MNPHRMEKSAQGLRPIGARVEAALVYGAIFALTAFLWLWIMTH